MVFVNCWWADVAAKLSCDVADVEHEVILLKLNRKWNGAECRNRQHKMSRCSLVVWPSASTAFASLKHLSGISDTFFALWPHKLEFMQGSTFLCDGMLMTSAGLVSAANLRYSEIILLGWQKANSDIHTSTAVPIRLEHPRFLQILSQKIFTVSSDFDKWR